MCVSCITTKATLQVSLRTVCEAYKTDLKKSVPGVPFDVNLHPMCADVTANFLTNVVFFKSIGVTFT